MLDKTTRVDKEESEANNYSSFDTILLLEDPKHEKGKERLKSKTSENLVGQEIQLETYHLKGIKCHQ